MEMERYLKNYFSKTFETKVIVFTWNTIIIDEYQR